MVIKYACIYDIIQLNDNDEYNAKYSDEYTDEYDDE